MKKLTYWLLLFAIGFMVAACNNDDNDVLYAGMGTVGRNAEIYTITFDDGATHTLTDSTLLRYKGANTPGQRVIVSFVYAGGDRRNSSISLQTLYKVLTKDLFLSPTETQLDSIGNDGARLQNVWRTGEFLNTDFYIRSGHYTTKPHLITMVAPEGNNLDSEGLLRLEFRHNLNGNTPLNAFHGYASFRLTDEQLAAKGFRITYKDMNNREQTFTVPNTSQTGQGRTVASGSEEMPEIR